jgi:ABC-type multidrug transport system permease subunit
LKIDPKWVKLVGLALSFPSTIFVSAYLSMSLHQAGYLSKIQSVLLFLAVVLNSLFMIVYYAYKKNKS